MKNLMIALMVAGALAVGCGNKEAASGSGASGGEAIGVAECDEYITKMDACMAKDAKIKDAMEGSYKQTRDAWKQTAAGGGAAKANLKQACGAAVAAMPANCK